MKNRHIFGIVLFSVIAVIACKKKVEEPKKEDEPAGKSKIEILTESNWKITNLVSGNTDIWNTPFIDACNKDNQYNFKMNDSLTVYDKASKCDPSDPDSTSSFYQLYNDNKQLILNVKLTPTVLINDTVDIVTLDETTLKINAQYSGLPATITFKH